MAADNDGLKIPIEVQTKGDLGKEAIEAIKTARDETAKAVPVIRDYADAEKSAAEATEERAAAEAKFAAAQKDWQSGKGTSGLASDPQNFPDIEAEDAARRVAEREQIMLAAEERRVNLMTQRQIIADMEVEAVEKQAAGETKVAEQLTREVEMRKLALQYQTKENIEEAEAFSMAQRKLDAERQLTIQEAEQLALKKQQKQEEAEQLALEKQRQKDGTLSGESGRIGALGKNLGIDAQTATAAGVIAMNAQQVVDIIHGFAKMMDEERLASERQTMELQKQAAAWNQVAGAAQSMSDVNDLQEQMTKKIVEAQEQLRLIPIVSDSAFRFMVDGLVLANRSFATLMSNIGAATPFAGTINAMAMAFSNVKTSGEAATQQQEEYIKKLAEVGKASTETAKESAEMWARIMAMPVEDRLEHIPLLIEAWRRQQAAANTTTAEGGREWLEVDAKIKVAQEALKATQQEYEKLGASTEANGKKIRDAMDKALPDEDRLEQLKADAQELKDKIAEMGLEAETPNDALKEMHTLAVQQQDDVAKIAAQWQSVTGEIDKVTERMRKRAEQEQKKADELQAKRDKALADTDREQALLEAEATGVKAIVDEKKIQLDYEKQIADLKRAGVPEAEAKAEADKTRELREQVKEKEKDRKLDEINADVNVEEAKAGKGKRKLLDAETTKVRLDEQNKALAAGATPEEALAIANRAGEAFRKQKLREEGRIDGSATTSAAEGEFGKGLTDDEEWKKQFAPRGVGEPDATGLGAGPTTRSDRENIGGGKTSDAEWEKMFGRKGKDSKEVFGPPAPEKAADDAGEGKGGKGGGDPLTAAAEKVKDGGEKTKDAAAKMVDEGGKALDNAGRSIEKSAGRLETFGDRVTTVCENLDAKVSGFEARLSALEGNRQGDDD